MQALHRYYVAAPFELQVYRNAYLASLVAQLLLTLWLRRLDAYHRLRTLVIAAFRVGYTALTIAWLRLLDYESDSPTLLVHQLGRYGVLAGGLLTQNTLALCMPVPLVWHLLIQAVTTGLMLRYLSNHAATLIAQSDRARLLVVDVWSGLKSLCLATQRVGRSSLLTPQFFADVGQSHEHMCLAVTLFLQLLLGFVVPTACHSSLELIAKDNFTFMWRKAVARERGVAFHERRHRELRITKQNVGKLLFVLFFWLSC